jgi:hypothetical protein
MTHMKLRMYIIAIMVALLLLMVFRTALAQESIVSGLAPGNVFTYIVTGSYSSGAPIADVPDEVISAQATEYFKVTIVNVAGPEIGYSWFWQFNNGTSITNSSTLNIETVENTGPFWPIVSANLTAGERIHPQFGPDLSTFNETVMYTYTNYTRETNRLELTSAQQKNVTQAIRTVHSDAYFDRQTGMLVQLNDETDYQNPAFTTTITWKLSGQNVWTYASAGSYPPAPLFSLPVIIAIVVVVAIVVVIAGWFVSNKRRNTRRKQLLKKK